MNKKTLENILLLLKQVGGPVSINYQTTQITLITESIINYHIEKITGLLSNNKDFISEYSVSDIYSLYGCLNFIISDLGEDEYVTITGKDLYENGFRLLMKIKKHIF